MANQLIHPGYISADLSSNGQLLVSNGSYVSFTNNLNTVNAVSFSVGTAFSANSTSVVAPTINVGTNFVANTTGGFIVNPTSGAGLISSKQTYLVTTSQAAIGSAIADVFTSPSSVSLEAASLYKIKGQVYFLKNTAGTATWTNLFSNAPTIFEGFSRQTAITGMTAATGATYTPLLTYYYDQGATTVVSAATGSLTTAVNHFFAFEFTVLTNSAANWRLRLTQSAGTANTLAGSYYTVEKIATSTGTFAA
jgi:hypothetical protein